MKTKLFTNAGEAKNDIELPSVFSVPIREDLASKYFEVEKFDLRQPYASYEEAGKRHSASGIISHRRHEWKGHYGKGISRLPRKIMWRRGTQFFWVGAEVSGTRGGRRSHPPKGVYSHRKINKKEAKSAFASAFAATASKEHVLKRYSSLSEVPPLAAVLESLPKKAKELNTVLEKIYGKNFSSLLKSRKVRPGKGKNRGRHYKSNAGLLIVTGKDEKVRFHQVEVKQVKEINMTDLFPLGRITLYTKQSLEDLKNVA